MVRLHILYDMIIKQAIKLVVIEDTMSARIEWFLFREILLALAY